MFLGYEMQKRRCNVVTNPLEAYLEDMRDIRRTGVAVGVANWRNTTATVRDYYIRGYQVIKKWLSYREQVLLGLALRAEEAREVTGMALHLARIVLLEPTLNANYELAKAHSCGWSGVAGPLDAERKTE